MNKDEKIILGMCMIYNDCKLVSSVIEAEFTSDSIFESYDFIVSELSKHINSKIIIPSDNKHITNYLELNTANEIDLLLLSDTEDVNQQLFNYIQGKLNELSIAATLKKIIISHNINIDSPKKEHVDIMLDSPTKKKRAPIPAPVGNKVTTGKSGWFEGTSWG